MRHNILAMATSVMVVLASLLPTVALAAPSRHNDGHRAPQKHSSVRFKQSYRNSHKVYRHAPPRREHRVYHSPSRRHYPAHRARRFYHNGRGYYHGIYDGWYHGRHHTLHSRDWIRMIGIGAFVALISNRDVHNQSVIVNKYGEVIAVIDD